MSRSGPRKIKEISEIDQRLRSPVLGTSSEDAEVVCGRILIYQDFQRTPFKKRGNLYLVQSKKFRKLICN